MKKPVLVLMSVALGASLLTACGPSARDEEALRARRQQIMAETVDPLAWTVWRSAGYIINEEGEHNLAPTTDEGWEAVRVAALDLAASHELLLASDVAPDNESWGTYARGMAAQAEVAAAAAAAHDDDALFNAGGAIYNVCSGCHQQFSPQVTGQ